MTFDEIPMGEMFTYYEDGSPDVFIGVAVKVSYNRWRLLETNDGLNGAFRDWSYPNSEYINHDSVAWNNYEIVLHGKYMGD